MNSRFAQIIAQCTDAAGHVDHTKLFDALMLDPGDPTALMVDAAIFGHEQLEELKIIVDDATEKLQRTAAVQRRCLEEAGQKNLYDLTRTFDGTVREVLDEVHERADKIHRSLKSTEDMAAKLILQMTKAEERLKDSIKQLEGLDGQIGAALFLFSGTVAASIEAIIPSEGVWVLPAVLFLLTVLTLCGFFRWLERKMSGGY